MGHEPKGLGRRKVLRAVGTGIVLAPFAPLIACSGDDRPAVGMDGGGMGTDSGPVPMVDGGPPMTDAGGNRWATGGTAGMTGRAAYPDPFAGATGTTCSLFCSLTLGPCYEAMPPMRS